LRQVGAQPLLGLMVPAAPQKTAVVLIYPNRVGALALVSYFRVIRSAGYAALIIDDTKISGRYGFGWEQREDVLDAAQALRGRGVEKIAVLGVSAGAAAALFAGSESASITAIISDSSYADASTLMRRIPPLDSLNPLFDRTVLWEFGLMEGSHIEDIAPARAAAQLDGRPLMVINGADDPLVPPADARKIFAAARGPRELWIVPGAGHAAALATNPAQYAQRVSAFLTRYLGAPSTSVDTK
jgi:pimeloyl-ACP methyl ester carboxylesterase